MAVVLARLAGALLSAVLLFLAFPSADLGFLAWVALVPLLLAVAGLKKRGAFFLGWASGFLFYAGLLYWIGIITPPGMVALSAYLGLYTGVFCLLVSVVLARGGSMASWVLPAAWVLLEFLRTYFLSGFPWGVLGYSQHRYLHVASVGGVYAVSFVIAAVNGALAWGVQAARLRAARKGTLPWALSAASVLLAVACGVWGAVCRAPQGPGEPWRIAVVQGNFELDYRNMALLGDARRQIEIMNVHMGNMALLGDARRQIEIMNVHMELSDEAAKEDPELIVWSETTYPFGVPAGTTRVPPIEWERQYDVNDRFRLSRFIAGCGVPHLVGINEAWPKDTPDPSKAGKAHNSAFLFDAEGDVTARYRKMHLVPFGEKTPLYGALPFLEEIVVDAGGGGFLPGEEPGVMSLPGGGSDRRFGVLICYEAIFPEMSRRLVREGASVLVNITNDAWFGTTSAPYQHAAMAAFRSVENATPLVRCANTGISFAVTASGEVENPVRGPSGEVLNCRGWVMEVVQPGSGPTLYTRWGDILPWACVAAVPLWLAAGLFKRGARSTERGT
jgi:apolipoprotein N-acyltransferase